MSRGTACWGDAPGGEAYTPTCSGREPKSYDMFGSRGPRTHASTSRVERAAALQLLRGAGGTAVRDGFGLAEEDRTVDFRHDLGERGAPRFSEEPSHGRLDRALLDG